MRNLQARLLAGEDITPEQFDTLLNVNQVRHHLASTAINTKGAEKVAQAYERHLELQGQLVGDAIGVAMDRLGLSEPWRDYALRVAHHALCVADGDDPGDEPQPAGRSGRHGARCSTTAVEPTRPRDGTGALRRHEAGR